MKAQIAIFGMGLQRTRIGVLADWPDAHEFEQRLFRAWLEKPYREHMRQISCKLRQICVERRALHGIVGAGTEVASQKLNQHVDGADGAFGMLGQNAHEI